MAVKPNQFALSQLFLGLTTIGIGLAFVCGVWRYSQYIIVTVEREHWATQIREGRPLPSANPGNLFSPQELEELRTQAKLRSAKPAK